MSFDVNNDANWLTVKNTLFSQPGNVPVALPDGQGIYNPGERSHGLDASQVHDFLLHFVEYICSQATAGGVVLTSTVVQNAVNAAKNQVLSGNRSYTFNPVTDTNFAAVLQRLSFLRGSDSDLWLQYWIQDICQRATAGGVTLNAGVIQITCDAAKSSLIGNRSF